VLSLLSFFLHEFGLVRRRTICCGISLRRE
jgi:hypothetical protein